MLQNIDTFEGNNTTCGVPFLNARKCPKIGRL